jgi:hypothetical protein
VWETEGLTCISEVMAAVRRQAYAWPVSKLAGFSPCVRLPPYLVRKIGWQLLHQVQGGSMKKMVPDPPPALGTTAAIRFCTCQHHAEETGRGMLWSVLHSAEMAKALVEGVLDGMPVSSAGPAPTST